jgi:hypothetical protein
MTEKERLDATIQLLATVVHFIYVLGRMAPSGGLYEHGYLHAEAQKLLDTLPVGQQDANTDERT